MKFYKFSIESLVRIHSEWSRTRFNPDGRTDETNRNGYSYVVLLNENIDSKVVRSAESCNLYRTPNADSAGYRCDRILFVVDVPAFFNGISSSCDILKTMRGRDP